MSLIKRLKQISLSNEELDEILGKDTLIYRYPMLAKYQNIDDLLGPNRECIILYMTGENYGHWTCLFEAPDGTLEFFDSYGYFIDDELDFNNDLHFRREQNQDYPHLTWLLYNSGYPISYNQYQFQSDNKDITTCGRHVAVRLLLRHLTLDEYKDFIDSFKDDPDTVVTLLTSFVN